MTRHPRGQERDAAADPWSDHQIERQINRLNTLKRAMCGRAAAELLRARKMPPPAFTEHEM